ncbi:MAG: peptidoglycan DD-metalloendopeptidase family protein, partial [Lachnospiraceae bacterium]|nr:peptidoglycan DD-metalloendopeptidase family protein [Lachnospiraceae bacterium]
IFESILTGKNLEDILTKAEYIQSITDYDRKKLNELVDIKNQIIIIENQLEQEKRELILLKETEIAQKENIEVLIEEKTKEIEDMNSRINTSNAELKKLIEAQKRQEAEIEAIERAILARGNSNRILSGGLIWPCPSSKQISSGFGKRKSPTKGASTYHQGIDIRAKTGAGVLAAAAGEVVISTYSYSAGNYIMINHGSGIFTIYMHLSKKLVDVNQEVSQGQKIGEVGSTGVSTGPHLHFGIRKNGSYVNPLTFVG